MGSRLVEENGLSRPSLEEPGIRHRYGLADRLAGRAVLGAGTSGGLGIP